MRDGDIKDKTASLEPLTDDQLRQLWVSAPYPEVRQLLWEVRRLQEQLITAHGRLLNVACGYTLDSVTDRVIDMTSEPCIQRWAVEQMTHESIVRGDRALPPMAVEDQKKWLKARIDNSLARSRAAHQPD